MSEITFLRRAIVVNMKYTDKDDIFKAEKLLEICKKDEKVDENGYLRGHK